MTRSYGPTETSSIHMAYIADDDVHHEQISPGLGPKRKGSSRQAVEKVHARGAWLSATHTRMRHVRTAMLHDGSCSEPGATGPPGRKETRPRKPGGSGVRLGWHGRAGPPKGVALLRWNWNGRLVKHVSGGGRVNGQHVHASLYVVTSVGFTD